MAYCTVDEVKTLVLGMLNRNSTITEADIEYFIETSDINIDAKLNGVYSVPFSDPVPSIIVNISKFLTVCYLLKSLFTGDSVNINKNIPFYCEHASKMLDALMKQEISIPGVTPIIAGFKKTGDFPKYFNKDEPINWRISRKQEKSISDKRKEGEC